MKRNRSRPFLPWAAAGIALFFLCAGRAGATLRYSVTGLQGLRGVTESRAYAINDSGEVAGQAKKDGRTTAFAWFPKKTELYERGMNLINLSGFEGETYGRAINNRHVLVGFGQVRRDGSVIHPFRENLADAEDFFVDLGTLGGPTASANAVNDRGQVAGTSSLANGQNLPQDAFLSREGQKLDPGKDDLGFPLRTKLNWRFSVLVARDVNDQGLVVGSMTDAFDTEETHAFFWRKVNGMTDLTPAAADAGANKISRDRSIVVGWMEDPRQQSQVRGVIWETATWKVRLFLPTLGGRRSMAYDVGGPQSGLVVGEAEYAMNSTDTHAFVYDLFGEGMIDLNTLIPADQGWVLQSARGINTAGQIVGWGRHNGNIEAFRLTPAAPGRPQGREIAESAESAAGSARATLEGSRQPSRPAPGRPATGPLLESIGPNPFSGQTRIGYRLPGEAAVRVSVFDAGGRVAAILRDDRESAGTHDVLWDGRDAMGRRLPPGVYFLRLECGNHAVEDKIILGR